MLFLEERRTQATEQAAALGHSFWSSRTYGTSYSAQRGQSGGLSSTSVLGKSSETDFDRYFTLARSLPRERYSTPALAPASTS